MSTRRLWYVLPLDILPDPNQPIVMMEEAPQAFAQEDVPAPQPRNRNQREVNNLADRAAVAFARVAQPAGGQRGAGQVFKIDAKGRKEFTEACTTEALAFARAEQRAALEPKRPFGVFSCIGVVETMEAPLIRKEFNDVGELRIKPEVDHQLGEEHHV